MKAFLKAYVVCLILMEYLSSLVGGCCLISEVPASIGQAL